MTERRLKEIFIEAVFPTVGVTDETLLWFETRDLRKDYIEAMKRAVNEVLEEAAEKAEAWVDTKGQWTTLKEEARVSKKSILNLKVK